MTSRAQTTLKTPKPLTMARLKGKQVLIVGLGLRTGVSLAQFLHAHGAIVHVYDKKPAVELADSLARLSAISARKLQLHLGSEQFGFLEQIDLVITSPGIPLSEPIFEALLAHKLTAISELEFASWYLKDPIIAVTGSNGKTTTCWLIAQLMQFWGRRAFLGGNYGVPLVEAVGRDFDFLICETSSFQLETCFDFHPQVAILTNLTDNHLDRHKSMEHYGALKARIFANQKSSELAIVNGDDPWAMRLSEGISSHRVRFSLQDPRAEIFSDRQNLVLRLPYKRQTVNQSFSLKPFGLVGDHNLQNLMAVVAAGVWLGVPPSTIETLISQATAPRHRLERVVSKRSGVTFINDSKSTTVDSTLKAVACFSGPLILILGGKEKGTDYRPLGAALPKSVRQLVVYGEAREKIAQQLGARVELKNYLRFADAVHEAKRLAQDGDTVLLSPAASSLDQFSNYEERGDAFCTLVAED